MKPIVPLVSVILPVFNGEEHLSECIESVLDQSFQDFEFIIVDDASNDQTPNILKHFAEQDKRIRIIRHVKNQKQTTAANTAINSARGEYLARMDADDIALPERFIKQVDFLNDHPSFGMVGTWADIIDNEGGKLKEWQTLATNGLLKWNLLFGTSFVHSSVMMRKNIVQKVGLYQSPEAEDYDLWSRISWVSDVANIEQVLQQKRVWAGQLALKVPQETRDCVIEIMRKNISSLVADKELSLDFVRNIRSVSDKTPVIEDNATIMNVRKILNKMYSRLRQKVDLTDIENKRIKQDLFQKHKTISDWQINLNLIKGLIAKTNLFIRYPKYYIYNFIKNSRQ